MLTSLITEAQHHVGTFNGWISSALNGNTLVAGAATASIIGSLFFVLRKMPRRAWNYVKRFIFFTYTIEYEMMGGRSMIQTIAQKFEHELQKRVSHKRGSARLTTRKKRIAETLSDGGFMFRYRNAWIWVSRSQNDQQGAVGNNQNNSVPKKTVTLSLTTLRPHRSKIMEVLAESAKEYSVPGIYQMVAPSWSGDLPPALRIRNFTSLPPLALDHQVRESVDKAIEKFLATRDRKNANDEPHKLVFLFHGEPGTGKSALGEYIAFKLRTSLFCINGISVVEGHRALHLSDALLGVRENITDQEVPVILCDDFDTFWQGLRRRTESDKESLQKRGFDPEDNIVLGRMLATLQSPTELNDCVVIFTTNHLEKIDPAMYRPGRVTVLCEIGRMSPKSVMEYFEMVYGQPWPAHTPIERALRACDIGAFREANEDNPQGFVQAVTSTEQSADELFNTKADATTV